MSLRLVHPNDYINQALAVDVIKYLRQIKYKRTDSRINKASFSFLERAEIPPDTKLDDLLDSYNLVYWAAQEQFRIAVHGGEKASFRGVVRENPELAPLISHAPQCLFLDSYSPLNKNLYLVDSGVLTYGYKKDLYREIVKNVIAARYMNGSASQRVANEIYRICGGDSTNVAILGLGSGNGAAELDVVKKFVDNPPMFIVSDFDPETEKPARELFAKNGIKKINWAKIDLRLAHEVRRAARMLEGKRVFVLINFIIHELEEIAETLANVVSAELPNATIVASEVLLREDQLVFPEMPEFFITEHDFAVQYLRSEPALLKKMYDSGGYNPSSRIDHQIIGDLPFVSTFFLNR